MKPSLTRIGTRLLAEPWLIRSDKYASLVSQFRAATVHRSGQQIRIECEDDDDDCPPMDMKIQRQADMDCLADLQIMQGIAIIPVFGILGKHLDMMDLMCGGYDVGLLQRQAMALMNRADVHTVILHLNTPGGAAAGIADVGTTLLELGSQKRLLAYVDEACSGGQWIACCASEIYIGASAMAGSISAVCAIHDESKAYEMEGVKVDVFTDGDLKGAGIEGTSLTASQRADIQGRIEYIGGVFKDFVKLRRPAVTDDSLRGQWFYGSQAVERGLADAITPSLEHVIALALP